MLKQRRCSIFSTPNSWSTASDPVRILLANNRALGKGALAPYNMNRVELKSFTFSSGAQSLSIDKAVFGTIPKRLLFTMVKNTEYLGSVTTNPYHFRHYDLRFSR